MTLTSPRTIPLKKSQSILDLTDKERIIFMTKVFTQDMAKRMVAYEIKTPFGSSSLGLAIPEGFTRIEKGAFENMDIDTVIFPKSLEVIAFS